jgi:F-type H+-transporting ATPase subunit gamma
MPPAQIRQVRRRIRSVESTRKVTRAMGLVATSRILKAQRRLAAARPYFDEISRVVGNVVADGGRDHRLLRTREDIGRIGLVVLAADRGLAGAYNANVLRLAERHLRKAGSGTAGYALFLVGRKAEAYFRYRGYEIRTTHEGMSDAPAYEDARLVAGEALAAYDAGDVDIVEVVSTQFLSMATQRAVRRRLLPVESFDGHPRATAYELEPGEPAVLLDLLLPRYVEACLFAALLDAAASEHAARQRAMKAASDNAAELVRTLRREANQARQAEITTEIMEIVGGAEALRRSTEDDRGRRAG